MTETATPRILVIEDEPEILDLVSDELACAGYVVVKADNGVDGYQAILRERPDLVLSDVTMPGMTGFEMVERLRRDHPDLAAMPVIFLTALADGKDVVQGRKLGADEYLTKPIDFDLMLAAVQSRLRTSATVADAAEHERERIRSTFLTVVPEELREPLNVIMGFADLIRHDPPDSKQAVAEYADTIKEAAQRLLATVNDIIDIAAIGRGTLSVSDDTVDVARLLGAVSGLVSERACIKEVSLSIEAPPGVRVRADQRLLQQAVLHLVSNAVAFTPSGGKVRITGSRLQSGDVVIGVLDNGVGIHPNHLKRLMAPFEQGDASRKRRHDGLGLGLALTRGYCQALQGALLIDSKPGKGTIARIRLPKERVLSA